MDRGHQRFAINSNKTDYQLHLGLAKGRGGSEEHGAVRSLEEVRGTWGRRSSLVISRVDLGQSLVQDKKQLRTKGFCHKVANVPPL